MTKAFLVQERFGEGRGKIVFDSHGLRARRLGAQELDLEFDEVECRRVPEYDKFFPKVPIKELIKNGWWWECGCGQIAIEEEIVKIDEDKEEVYCEKCLEK